MSWCGPHLVQLFGTLWASWISMPISFTRLGKFYFIIFSNKFLISCSSSSPDTPMIPMLERLKLSQRFLSFSSFFWILGRRMVFERGVDSSPRSRNLNKPLSLCTSTFLMSQTFISADSQTWGFGYKSIQAVAKGRRRKRSVYIMKAERNSQAVAILQWVLKYMKTRIMYILY